MEKFEVFYKCDYEPPKAEVIMIEDEGLLCASSEEELTGGIETFVIGGGDWGGCGGLEGFNTSEGDWGSSGNSGGGLEEMTTSIGMW